MLFEVSPIPQPDCTILHINRSVERPNLTPEATAVASSRGTEIGGPPTNLITAHDCVKLASGPTHLI